MANSEKEAKKNVVLLNSLFDTFIKNPLKDLVYLSNENNYKKILLEIEPELEKIGGQIEITKDDNSFAIRYSNYVSIINSFDKYLSKHADKEKFTTLKFKNMIVINDIIKNDSSQLTLMSDLLIFLSSISSRKDIYLEKVGELDNALCDNFFNVIEKYILIDSEAINQSKNMTLLDKSMVSNYASKFDKERNSLINVIKENENKITSLKAQIDVLEKSKLSLELTIADKDRELEMLKKSQEKFGSIKEELINHSIETTELKTKLGEANLKIDGLTQENILITKKYLDKLKEMEEKLDIANESIMSNKELKNNYDKLNNKYKELQLMSKNTNTITKEQLDSLLEQKDKEIELANMKNKGFEMQIDKINKDYMAEKENVIKCNYDKRRLELENTELKNEINILKESKKELMNDKNKNETENKNNEGFAMKDILKDQKHSSSNVINNNADNNSSKGNEETIFNLKSENFNLNTEIKILRDNYDNLIKEKNKIDLESQKSDLEKQKIISNYERAINENKTLKEDIKNLNDKINGLNKNLKKDLKTKANLIEIMLKEKKSLINNYEKLQKEFDEMKKEKDKIEKVVTSSSNNIPIKNTKTNVVKINLNDKDKDKDNKDSIILSNNSEILSLKNQIQNLKLQNLEKEDQIRKLKDSLEEEKENLSASQQQNNFTNLTEEEINIKLTDLDFYKKSYQEQKERVNKEHDLISESLYKLAEHFMSLKGELQKRIHKK